MALLPNYERVFVAIEKLSDYCLNPYHPVGKDKATVFKSVLNITKLDFAFLKDATLKGLAENKAMRGTNDQYGKRFTVDIKLRNIDKAAIITTGWIIKKGESFLCLTTCYLK